MIEELEKKLLKIGKEILDELELHNHDITIEGIKMISGDYIIDVNGHFICQLSSDEFKYLEEHRNE